MCNMSLLPLHLHPTPPPPGGSISMKQETTVLKFNFNLVLQNWVYLHSICCDWLDQHFFFLSLFMSFFKIKRKISLSCWILVKNINQFLLYKYQSPSVESTIWPKINLSLHTRTKYKVEAEILNFKIFNIIIKEARCIRAFPLRNLFCWSERQYL